LYLVHTLAFWLLLQVIGLLALPLTLRLLRFLPDRGYAYARPLGLLLMGYLLWILVTLGILQNTTGNTVLVLLAIGGVSWAVWRRHRQEMLDSLKQNARLVIATEVLFFVALMAFATFRAFNPDIAATEKPMEFGFINGILRSTTFPPKDPWLAGFGISYYYLGYVIAAALTRLVGLPSDITFNLVGSLLFALTVTGAFGLCANLVLALGSHEAPSKGSQRGGLLTGLLGALFVAVIGNLEGVFELVRARGWGSERLWQWLDVKGLGTTAVSSRWYPDDMWWWWRASRVIHDKNLAGQSVEVIDEFPFFSFLLGDNHPHVLTLPFVFLALALALNLLLARPSAQGALESGPLGSGVLTRFKRFLRELWDGSPLDWLLYGLCLGSLGFLNTWDYPIYLTIAVVCYAVARQRVRRFGWAWLQDTIVFGAAMLLLGVVLYLPFYIGFRSQAGGIGLVGPSKTRIHQYLLMMGIFVFFVLGWLVALWARWRGTDQATRRLPLLAQGIGGALGLLALFCAIQGWWTATLVLALLALAGPLLVWGAQGGDERAPLPASVQFGLLLAMVGLALTGSVEFVFLSDTFGTRMNTVFKFYYQGWVLLACASALGAYWVSKRLRAASGLAVGLWGAVAALLVALGLVYPVAAIPNKTNGFAGPPTLDGTGYIARYRPDDYAAVQWLRQNAALDAVLLEAPGGSYSEYNWVSAHTGIPTLLGWGGHELQWRGNYDEAGRREPDIEAIYTSADRQRTAELLDQYGIDYVYVGRLERDKYHLNPSQLRKLEQMLVPVFQQGSVTIYARVR
jgi:YYY domain-containing protein